MDFNHSNLTYLFHEYQKSYVICHTFLADLMIEFPPDVKGVYKCFF